MLRLSPERMRSRLSGHLLAALLLCTGSFGIQALPDDQQQPIHISADHALRDEKQGITVYTGHVELNQGSLQITAERLTIHHVSEDPSKIVAEGKPARMQQQPEPDKGMVTARANLIEYYQEEDRVHLSKNARIEQAGSTVTGETIDYFIAEQRVTADSDKSSDSSRVEVVIPARNTDAGAAPKTNSKDARGATDSQ